MKDSSCQELIGTIGMTNYNPHFFKIVGPVVSSREGYKTIKIELDYEASDWLCKAMALQVAKQDAELQEQYEQLQQEVIKAWEAFRPA
jgi:hypothetical protein